MTIIEPGTRIRYDDFRVALPGRVRVTALGLATVGCQANPLGVRPTWTNDVDVQAPDGIEVTLDPDPFETAESIHEHLDGCERWDIDHEASTGEEMSEWVLVKSAGPYLVEDCGTIFDDDHMRLHCACGWVGNKRHFSKRRLLNADQAAHACFEEVQLDLEV